MASGKVLLNYEAFDLREVITAVSHNNRCLMRLKQLSCSVNVADNVPQHVISDKFKITQILLNYVSNAIKFSPAESTISVHSHVSATQVTIAVDDEGPGVPLAQRHLLFQRFIQLPNGDFENGTGLGLSICDQLARMIDGRVWFEERSEGGSRFSFVFPLRVVDEGIGPSPSPSPPLSPNKQAPKKINRVVDDAQEIPRPVLIVEDNMYLLT